MSEAEGKKCGWELSIDTPVHHGAKADYVQQYFSS